MEHFLLPGLNCGILSHSHVTGDKLIEFQAPGTFSLLILWPMDLGNAFWEDMICHVKQKKTRTTMRVFCS